MGIKRSITVLLAFAIALPAFAESLPITYVRIAQKHSISATDLYQQAISQTGYQAPFTQIETPWPFALKICKGDSCTVEQPGNRTELFGQATKAINQGFAVSLGPTLINWEIHKDQIGSNLWVATDPVVTLNLAARTIALQTNQVKTSVNNQNLTIKSKPYADILRPAEAVTLPDFSGTSSTPRHETVTASVINQWVDQLSTQYDLDPDLVKAVIQHESNYNPDAVSHAGAVGLMQLMPATGRAYGVPTESRTDPVLNIKGGMAYLKDLSQVYDNDIMLMLAAYNAGETAVTKYGNTIPPYPETVQYVLKVMNTYLKRIGSRSA